MTDLVEQIVHRRSSSSLSAADVAEWPDIDMGALSPSALAEYLRRKRAVLNYLAGATDAQLRETVNFSKHTVAALLRTRCLKPHPDGNVLGWRGLVRYARLNPFIRQKPLKPTPHGHGAAGALGLLLSLEPDFAQRFQRYILKTVRKDALGEIRRPRHVIWAWFLAELRKLGYEARNQWPFTVQTQGYASVARYVDKLLSANPAKAALLVGGPDAKKKLLTGDGTQRPQLAPFQRVEMDAHKLDCRVCIMVPQLEGGWAPKIVHRVWVICVVEVVTRAVLGYYLSLRREVALEDVIRTLKCALSRWQLPEMVFATVQQLRPQAGLPSSHNEDYASLCWDEMSVDGALAETCKTVRVTLANVVGAQLLEPTSSFSVRRSKDDRPFIERFFSVLAAGGVGRISNTTGSAPAGKQGRDPGHIAVTRQFQLPYLEELLAALIANYNATPHASLGHRTPLSLMDFLASQHRLPTRRADPQLVQALLSVRKLCIVKGGYAVGRRPYVNFEGARYSGAAIGDRHDLVGKRIWVINHLEDDARVVMASTQEGAAIGVLLAGPPWHRLPHSLAIRRVIKSMINHRMFTLSSSGDAITLFMEYCERQAGGKLPVHPTYMAIQRVLAQSGARSTQRAGTEPARHRAGELAEELEACDTEQAIAGRSRAGKNLSRRAGAEAGTGPAQGPASGDNSRAAAPQDRSAAQKPLPMLRMAANN